MSHRRGWTGILLGALAIAGCDPASEERREAPAEPQGIASPPAAEVAPASEITCSFPVKPTDTAATLHERFGADSRAETLYGPEGIELAAVALWPDDPTRRVEVVLSEDALRAVSMVSVSERSAWHISGLRVGDTLARVQEVNGAPFDLWGFGWDYGGFVTDLKDGKLASLPDGCRVMIRVGPAEQSELPEGLVGEVELSSNDPRLATVDVRIEELSIGFE